MQRLFTYLTISVLTIFSLIMFSFSHADTLKVGQLAPGFELIDQNGIAQSLESFKGKWVVLYFYPKDDTPGCTKEACAFRDDYRAISAQNTQVLGVSIDSKESHAAFAEKYGLPFPLLADTGGLIAKKYQALLSLGPIKLAKRYTFIIDPSNIIQRIYRKVDASSHSQQILADLNNLQAK